MNIAGCVPTPLNAVVEAALSAVDPERGLLAPWLPATPPRGRTCVLAVGKAAPAMARAVEKAWPGALEGVVITAGGHERPLARLPLQHATHPLPSPASVRAGEALLAHAHVLGNDDLALVLLSGGASSLAFVPVDGVTLEDLVRWTTALLRSGATITEINTVRRHLCRLKGGGLAAAAHPARVLTLALSDVAGGTPEAIGSGPTLPDPTSVADAAGVFAHYLPRETVPPFVETAKPGDPRFACGEFRIVASGKDALAAAARAVSAAGYLPIALGSDLQGEAREVGAAHGRLALEMRSRNRPVALLSGGELTVTVQGPGRGGPNREYALGAARCIAGVAGIRGVAIDSDGIDGADDAAGAWFDGQSLARARVAGWDADAALASNDSSGFFAAIGGLIVTGPTGTNVNDLRVILVDQSDQRANA